MDGISEQRRVVARLAAAAFGGTPHVDRYYDVDETHAIDVLAVADRPTPGCVTYSTIGLHESPNLLDGTDLRVELVGMAPVGAERFANVLATAAFNVMKSGWLAAPGVVYPDLLSEYGLSETLEHVMWHSPNHWDELHRAEVAPELTVHWLLAVPITEAERVLLHRDGFEALDRQLDAAGIDLEDLTRPSTVHP